MPTRPSADTTCRRSAWRTSRASISTGRHGRGVRYQAIKKVRLVDPAGELVRVAKAVDIELGA
jgi:hypothetical protein